MNRRRFALSLLAIGSMTPWRGLYASCSNCTGDPRGGDTKNTGNAQSDPDNDRARTSGGRKGGKSSNKGNSKSGGNPQMRSGLSHGVGDKTGHTAQMNDKGCWC